MILYFADRKFNILGTASTQLPGGLVIIDDVKAGDVESGVDVFECKIAYDSTTRQKVETCLEVGNFILRKHDDEEELYTIIDAEIDRKKQTVYIYAEDAGMDLINEIVSEYEADQEYPIEYYFNKFAYDSGFSIGINEAEGLTRNLTFDNEETVTARLARIAAAFDNCEIAYRFIIEGLRCTGKVINIYKKRGQDLGVTLRLNKEIDNIITKKTIANIATALRATGATPDNADNPITLRGYEYDDGDFHVDGDALKSRESLKRWSRYINPDEPNQQEGHEGHIVRLFSFDTVDQERLFQETLKELKRVRDAEVNYEAEILSLPKNVKTGDRINIVDEAGQLYLSTRLLQLERSVVNDEHKAVLGEHLLKGSGISAKVQELAEKHAQTAVTIVKLEQVSNEAVKVSLDAREKAVLSVEKAEVALEQAEQAETTAVTAQEVAETAQASADNADNAAAVVLAQVTQFTDMLSSLVTDANGSSLMTQTAGGGWTFSMEAVQKAITSGAVNIEELANALAVVKGDIDTLADSLNLTLSYVRITELNGQPCIELGETDSDFKLRITNTAIQFADGTVVPAYISNKKLMIRQAEVTEELRFGNWIWKRRENGNFGLSWEGADE